MKRKVLRVAVLVAITLFAVIACGKKADDDRILLRHSFWGAYHDLALWQQIKHDFEELHPNVNVKLEYTPTDYRTKIRLQMIAGTAADVVCMDDESQAGFAVHGHLENLDPYIERDREELQIDDFLPTSLESFQWNGIQYSLPWDGFTVLIFCNLDLFDEAGISYPDTSWTYEDFRQIAIALTKDHDGDGRIDQFGTSLAFSFLGSEPFLWAWGADVIDRETFRSGFDTPEAHDAIEFLRQLVIVDNASPQAGQMPGIASEIAILTGRLAMVPGPTYLMQNLRATEGMRWDVFHMPKGPTGIRATRASWDGIAIYPGSDKKELAWEYIKFVLSRQAQQYIGEANRAMPVRRQDVYDFFLKEDREQHDERFLEATEYAFLTPAVSKFDAMDNATARWLDRIRTGSSTVEEALANLSAEYNEMLEADRQFFATQDTVWASPKTYSQTAQ